MSENTVLAALGYAKDEMTGSWYEQFSIRGKLMEWFNTEVESKFQDMLKTELGGIISISARNSYI